MNLPTPTPQWQPDRPTKTVRRKRGRLPVVGALRLVDLREQFDTVLNCHFFHILDHEERKQYVRSLTEAVSVDGRYRLCCSDGQPRRAGGVAA